MTNDPRIEIVARALHEYAETHYVNRGMRLKWDNPIVDREGYLTEATAVIEALRGAAGVPEQARQTGTQRVPRARPANSGPRSFCEWCGNHHPTANHARCKADVGATDWTVQCQCGYTVEELTHPMADRLCDQHLDGSEEHDDVDMFRAAWLSSSLPVVPPTPKTQQ